MLNLREILNPTGRRVSVGTCACPGDKGSPRPSSVGHHGLPAGHPVAIAIGDAQGGRSVGQRSIPSVPRRTPPGIPRPAPPGIPRPRPPGIPTSPRGMSVGQLGVLAALRALFAPSPPPPPGGWEPGKTRTCPPDGTVLAVKGTCPPGYYYDGEFQGCLGVCVPDAWHPDAPGGGADPSPPPDAPTVPPPDPPTVPPVPPYTHEGIPVPPPQPAAPSGPGGLLSALLCPAGQVWMNGRCLRTGEYGPPIGEPSTPTPPDPDLPAPSGPLLARAMSVGHRQDGREVNHTAGLGTQEDIYRMGLTKPGGAW